MDNLRFISFASGSSGNCFFVGNTFQGILIDAGIGMRTIRKRLKEIGMNVSSILGIFITHDHFDHVKAVKSLAEKYVTPIYATEAVHEAFCHAPFGSELPVTVRKIIRKETPVVINDWKITAFEVPHDGVDNVGYSIEYNGKTVTLLTDLGHVSEQAARYIALSNYLVIEANYDDDMLTSGPYPKSLQERIRSNTGHLSNDSAGRFLADHFPQNLRSIFLCHLSHSNNLPELACNTVKRLLEEKGIIAGRDVELVALNRTTPSELYEFE